MSAPAIVSPGFESTRTLHVLGRTYVLRRWRVGRQWYARIDGYRQCGPYGHEGSASDAAIASVVYGERA